MCFEPTAYQVLDKTTMISYKLNVHAGKFELINDIDQYEGQYSVSNSLLNGNMNMNGELIEFSARVNNFKNFELVINIDSKQHSILVKMQEKQMGNHDF